MLTTNIEQCVLPEVLDLSLTTKMKLLVLAVVGFILITSSKKFLVGTNMLNSGKDILDIDMLKKNMEIQKKEQNGEDYQDVGTERKKRNPECPGILNTVLLILILLPNLKF